jgi:excinuclease ABC subunit B
VKRTAQASLHTYDGSGEREEPAVAESGDDVTAVIAELEEEMQEASSRLEFERAAVLRDQINSLRSGDFRKAAKAAVAAEERGNKRRGKGVSRRR